MQPKFYPLGRFPSNPNYALSFMQQVAVNIALNEKEYIRSVNGPPGTGKTTLLKDIFSDLIVQQAKEICSLSNKKIEGSLVYWSKRKLAILPNKISDKGIVVASSNNGAVQNIVNELPKREMIENQFLKMLLDVDYFKEISNLESTTNKLPKNKEAEIKQDNWGTFSLEGGKASNIANLLSTIEAIEISLDKDYINNPGVYQEFLHLYNELIAERNSVQKYSEQMKLLCELENQYNVRSCELKKEEMKRKSKLNSFQLEINSLSTEINRIEKDLTDTFIQIEHLNSAIRQAERNYEFITLQKPSMFWFYKIFNKHVAIQYLDKLSEANDKLNNFIDQKDTLLVKKFNLEKNLKEKNIEKELKQQDFLKAECSLDKWLDIQRQESFHSKKEIDKLKELKTNSNIEELDFNQPYAKLQKSNPWFTKEFRVKQSELFILSLKVRKQFLYENRSNLNLSREIWSKQLRTLEKENGQQLIEESWNWINFVIPVISTTFASFGRMFRNLKENSIGHLFIDEAGQASPQASVGAIFRSKSIMVVGDPSQIKPVLTLDSNILSLLRRQYEVDLKFISDSASVQTLVDDASKYGFQKNEEEWIGIPLWVHRRSNYPMFTISNEISYNGLMVQGKPDKIAYGDSKWYDVSGKANDKFVKEQAEVLKQLILERIKEDPKLANDIYVISPFKNVVDEVRKEMKGINFTNKENKKTISIGTVHTFQGKEAKIVYFILGGDMTSLGAAEWAFSEPNIMNVAATRAKEEFHIIGDRNLYTSLNSKVINTTISVIDNYEKSNSVD